MCIRCSGKFSVIELCLRRDLKKSNETNIWISGRRALPAKGTAGNKSYEVEACLDCLRNNKEARMYGAEWQREESPEVRSEM